MPCHASGRWTIQSGRSTRRFPAWYRPRLEILEPRLPPGDSVLGALAGQALWDTPLGHGFSATGLTNHDVSLSPCARERASTTPRTAGTTALRMLPASPADALDGDAERPAATAARGLADAAPRPRLVTFSASAGAMSSSSAEAWASVQAVLPAGNSSVAPRFLEMESTTTNSKRLLASQASAVSLGAFEAEADLAQDRYGQLPLAFETNVGQTDASVDYIARTSAYTLFLTPAEAVLSVHSSARSSPDAVGPLAQAAVPPATVRLQVMGGNPQAIATPLRPLPGKVNYFLGNDPAQWHTRVPLFGRVEYQNVYPGIDLAYYATPQQELEYDFIVSPGADPSRIQLSFAGANSISLSAEGDLVIQAGDTTLVQPKPTLYQDIAGKRYPVEGSFRLDNTVCRSSTDYCLLSTVYFHTGPYDASHPLIIDPIVLAYSTYLGGAGTEYTRDIAVDASGAAYLTGQTYSAAFPLKDPFQSVNKGSGDAFVTKLAPDGSLAYSTYLGGGTIGCSTREDFGLGIAVDQDGNAYVVGKTGSCDFPVLNAFQPKFAGGSSDVFVTKLNQEGDGLVYSTYLGGVSTESGADIAVGPAGHAYIIGQTSSQLDFPIVNAIQPTHGGGGRDFFITKFTATGSDLEFSTFLGGSANEGEHYWNGDIALDQAGHIYVTGETKSYDFPTYNAFQPTKKYTADAFVSKLVPDGSAFVYSSFFGSDSYDEGRGITADLAGNAYFVGTGGRVPLVNPFDVSHPGAFLAKVRPDGSALAYSTYLGGTDSDSCLAVAVSKAGNAYVAGITYSTDFPIKDAYQGTLKGSADAFVTKFAPSGNALVYSTYLGGVALDSAEGIALDKFGSAYVAGVSFSTDFPTHKPFQPNHAGNIDVFVSKLRRGLEPRPQS